MKKHFLLFIGAIILLLLNTSCRSLPQELEYLEEQKIFTISPDHKSIVLDGVINSSAFDDFKELATTYPDAKLVIIINCDGSINDDVNLELAAYIHEHGFNTHLKAFGLIASGGTDLFLAGINRTVGENTKIGVHSWAGEDEKATDFPKGHKHHQPYIDYYKSLGFTPEEAKAFYYFTIYAAGPDDIHWMTAEELKKYKVITS